MTTTDSYPVLWALEGNEPVEGMLEISEGDIRLTGRTAAGDQVASRISAAEVFRIRQTSESRDRINGLAAVVVEERGGRRVRVAPHAGGEQVGELAALLQNAAALAGTAVERVVVRVPLRAEHRARVQELVRQGPPYDTAALPGLERHEVYVGGCDAFFVFEGPDPALAVERVMRDARVWSALADWREVVAGPPSILEPEYGWSRRRRPDDR
jgi:hypothetical protein